MSEFGVEGVAGAFDRSRVLFEEMVEGLDERLRHRQTLLGPHRPLTPMPGLNGLVDHSLHRHTAHNTATTPSTTPNTPQPPRPQPLPHARPQRQTNPRDHRILMRWKAAG